MSWEVEEDGVWYRVTAHATCPACGAELTYTEERRVAAGPPDMPELTVTNAGGSTVELSAVGMILPLAVHQCPAGGRAQ